jgi:tetratricopeptide (TPR) repeat protein
MTLSVKPLSIASVLLLALLAAGCGEAPVRQPDMPPNASDLPLMKTTKLCDPEPGFTQLHTGVQLKRDPWGSGSEVRIPADRSQTKADESYFFDQDGVLVGTLFTFPGGLDLKPYPILRDTLTQLQPAFEFYLNVANVASGSNLDTSGMYRTGDVKSTTQYLVMGKSDQPILLMASFALDPYEALLSPYRKEFLSRITATEKLRGAARPDVKGSEDKESFPMLQQFARGETAHLTYCESANEQVAVDAYRKAIAFGITNKARLADTHHKLGLALKAAGRLEDARMQLEESLLIRPNVKEVYNNLGTIYKEMRQRDKALAAFQKAVTLSPNYPIARFNLAEAYEELNPKLSISEYETYLALGEGYPEEEARMEKAKQRLKVLTK